ncbi:MULTISPECIES: hypothetical protein [Streptomyces]|uniref:Uncharacterized protein n=1 Tax=Streptomyces achmelvichensis TaxID=3134111 RepID=A0ACC6PLH4_9ACTN|nr:hypothetical protein [Streptomyces sp. NBC_00306]
MPSGNSWEPELRGALPERVAQWLSGSAAPAKNLLGGLEGALEAESESSALYALAWLITNMSNDRPILAVVDDMQWLDAPSLKLLLQVIPDLSDIPVLFIVGVRTSDVSHGGRLVELVLSSASKRTDLNPLSQGAANEVLAAEFGTPVDSE